MGGDARDIGVDDVVRHAGGDGGAVGAPRCPCDMVMGGDAGDIGVDDVLRPADWGAVGAPRGVVGVAVAVVVAVDDAATASTALAICMNDAEGRITS